MSRLFMITVVSVFFLGSGMGFANNPSDYDRSFADPDGYTSINSPDDQCVTDVITDDLNNVYIAMVVETTDGSTGRRPAVLKLSSSGNVDSSFGTNGVYVIPSDMEGGTEESSVDIGLASDGKIYVSFPGYGGTPSNLDYFLCCILADGSGLDTSFGVSGLSTVAFDLDSGEDPGDDLPYDLVVQSDGSIVLVGTIERGNDDLDIGITRFTSSGGLDSNFGTSGKVILYFDLGANDLDLAYGVAQTSSGELIIAGSASTADGWDLVVIALNSDGTMVSSFGYNGWSTYEYLDPVSGTSSTLNGAYAVTTAPPILKETEDGIFDTIYIGGTTKDPGAGPDGTMDMAVLCLAGDGNVCTDFGINGWSLIDFSDDAGLGIGETDDRSKEIFWDSSTGWVTLVGNVQQQTGSGLLFPGIGRVSGLDGTPDSGFGTDGHRHYSKSGSTDEGFFGSIDGNGRIVVSGSYYEGSTSKDDVWVARFITLDKVFSDDFESGNTDSWSGSTP